MNHYLYPGDTETSLSHVQARYELRLDYQFVNYILGTYSSIRTAWNKGGWAGDKDSGVFTVKILCQKSSFADRHECGAGCGIDRCHKSHRDNSLLSTSQQPS